ncbi:Zn-binding Pro-Ala-Ala-Arg (PAAR) domain-containing protein, incolved in TypeVI secretion [Paraburkholderia fungorum]|uniref:Zn-binding Pro-Ala-Ala-Arg (PAAR) domain-containing protein, incolved in TypeVI secretion n=1 Tax=Paraburkholderia fungorum TaxID=134537 RepID=A0A1H1ISX3_9BURK|nr:PAAR domain-containing protein [Paraburkholderia fungorum]SDR40787.1 Zn-binding Pro-Ala-Ala-Arg (PAAR) domain-containing protein, incolved in TypeVI secretion [Paraburkholderia fungorum]
MRVPVVRFGDPTTTGGKVNALHNDMTDGGKAIALHGERATCGNCKGTWPIFGSAHAMRNGGRAAVLHGDNVLCPCGQNRVISMSDSCFYHRRPGEDGSVANTRSSASVDPQSVQHDEQFTLQDATGRALPDTYYTVRLPSGQLVHGVTDGIGRTERCATEGARRLHIYLGHREE